MLRPSQKSILTSSRAAIRRTARQERARAAGQTFRVGGAVAIGVVLWALDLLLLVGLPIAYAAASFLVLALPLRMLFGGASFTLLGFLAWVLASGVSGVGLLRALQGSQPLAPVRPGFARVMLGLNWMLALVLAIADVAG